MAQGKAPMIAELNELIHDEHFMAFIQEKAWNYESRDDFLANSPPCGLDADTTWELVSFVRRMSGWPPVRSQMPRAGKALTPDLAFQTTPPSVEATISELAARCDEHSRLWEALEPLIRHRRIVSPLAEDLAAAVEREGLAISYETVRALILDTREPQGDDERIVANTAALLQEPCAPSAIPTADVLRNLHQAIVCGTDLSESAGRAAAAAPPSSMPEAFVQCEV
ncbi:hypothetical protein VJ923_09915, partial [Adlercreutzia sp. R25]|uniref:hypothetical protein n=1 Tax=Adlercreutzia shanghongiae TaxID=3111773 RepID=UPI002DB5B9B3